MLKEEDLGQTQQKPAKKLDWLSRHKRMLVKVETKKKTRSGKKERDRKLAEEKEMCTSMKTWRTATTPDRRGEKQQKDWKPELSTAEYELDRKVQVGMSEEGGEIREIELKCNKDQTTSQRRGSNQFVPNDL